MFPFSSLSQTKFSGQGSLSLHILQCVKVLRKSDEKLATPTWTLEHIMFTLGGLVPYGLHEEPVLGEHGRVVGDSWLQHQISANISSK